MTATIQEMLLEVCKRIIPLLTDEDYQFSVEANGTGWDVYRVRSFATAPEGQIAINLTKNKFVEVGWVGPGNRDEAEIKKLIEIGFSRIIVASKPPELKN